VSEWIELPGFPRTFNPTGAPWTRAVRRVHGGVEKKGDRPVILRPDRALVQKIEAEIIEAYRDNHDVAAIVESVLLANERHLDQVEWCRVRGDDLDLSIRVYGSRSPFRLYLALSGPVGRHADDTPPERSKPSAPRVRRAAPSPAASGPAFRVDAPSDVGSPTTPLHLRPIAPAASPCYGDAIAFDRAGRLHVALRLPDDADYRYAVVEPGGGVALATLPSREALRATDVGAMTAAMLPALIETSEGLVKIEHYRHARGELERIHIEGRDDRAHASRRGLFDANWKLGVWGPWFVRLIALEGRASLVAVDLDSHKRTKIALPEMGRIVGATVDRSPEGGVLRIVAGADELRVPLRVSTSVTLDLDALTTRAHGLPGLAAPVAGDGWVVADASDDSCGLWLARPDGRRVELFRLPSTFDVRLRYRPWNLPAVQRLSGPGEASRWLATFGFGPDAGDGAHCRGAVLFDAEGAVRARSWSEADGSLRINDTSLAGAGIPIGYAARATGDLAAVAVWGEDLSVLWHPPVPS
jgi:hypothetical protein